MENIKGKEWEDQTDSPSLLVIVHDPKHTNFFETRIYSPG
jgi:hypothetical protein